MNPWIWRVIIIILAVAFIPIIVNGTASLVTSGMNEVSQSIHSVLRPFSMRGGERMEGIIRLCLYIISITLVIRFLFDSKKKG
jgi:hypothetical protein